MVFQYVFPCFPMFSHVFLQIQHGLAMGLMPWVLGLTWADVFSAGRTGGHPCGSNPPHLAPFAPHEAPVRGLGPAWVEHCHG